MSPLDHAGGPARLIAADWVGSTPLPNQYSGRHISYSNWVTLYAPKATEVTRGKIQVGPASGGSAQVTVPACTAPVAAAGIVPNALP